MAAYSKGLYRDICIYIYIHIYMGSIGLRDITSILQKEVEQNLDNYMGINPDMIGLINRGTPIQTPPAQEPSRFP